MKPILPIKIYTTESELHNPLHLLNEAFKDTIRSRGLAWRLAVRDVNAQYRQAALGFLWLFILPATNAFIWLFLKNANVINIGDVGDTYAAYVFTGTILWAILTDSVTGPLQQASAARAMLVKINFPHEALILSGVYQALFNGVIRIIVLILALTLMGVAPGLNLLLTFFTLLSLVLAGTSAGLLITPIGLLYTDIGKSLPLLMLFLMYLTPVLFPIPQEGIAATVFKYNPFTSLIHTGRAWLTGAEAEYLTQFLLVNLAFLLLLFVVGILYRLAMPILIERMGN